MRHTIFRNGGLAASLILIAFGIGAIVIGAAGHKEVGDTLATEQIVGTPDMTPAAISKEVKAANLTGVTIPDKAVAGKSIDTGAEAKTFASYMRIHALLATGGQPYATMPRYATKDGKGTDDAAKALMNPESGKPVDNPARNIWVTETALTTALNTSFFAQSVALFSVVMGAALLLTGIGFLVLTLGLIGAARREEEGETVPAPRPVTVH
jgi:hypothetical protein